MLSDIDHSSWENLHLQTCFYRLRVMLFSWAWPRRETLSNLDWSLHLLSITGSC